MTATASGRRLRREPPGRTAPSLNIPFMTTLRRLFLLLVTLLFVEPALAQRSGVLLGIAGPSTQEEADTQDFATIHEPKYQTLWIATDAKGELKVLASVPELIVPRNDGFWHVGVKQVCEFDEDSKNESLRHVVWTAPVAKAGVVEQAQPCVTHKPEDYAAPYARTEQDKDKISQCGFELVNIEYVSPELISMSTYTGQSEDCEARGGRYSVHHKVRNFDADDALSFGQLLGPKAHNAYVRALPKHGQGDDGQDCGEPERTRDTGWRIAHNLGWSPYVHQDLGYFGCMVDAPVSTPLPIRLTGDIPTPIPWRPLRSKIEGIADAYVSPSSDLLIAVLHSETSFYDLRGGVPGKLLLKLPASGIVMVQWAMGTHVPAWTAQIVDFAGQHLPEPVVRVKSSSN